MSYLDELLTEVKSKVDSRLPEIVDLIVNNLIQGRATSINRGLVKSSEFTQQDEEYFVLLCKYTKLKIDLHHINRKIDGDWYYSRDQYEIPAHFLIKRSSELQTEIKSMRLEMKKIYERL